MISKKINFSVIIIIVILFSSLQLTNCSDPSSLPTPPLQYPNVFQGQVYNLSHPGPIPIGWTPPPLETVSTIVVLDTNKKSIFETSSDKKGKFLIMLPEGTYYLRVKESPIPVETGPYQLKEGETLEVKAYYDNGMR